MLLGARVSRPGIPSRHNVFGLALQSAQITSRLNLPPLASRLAVSPRGHRKYRASATRHPPVTRVTKRDYSTDTADEYLRLETEANARQARIQYGDSLPPGVLSDTEYVVYERLYGPPTVSTSSNIEAEDNTDYGADTSIDQPPNDRTPAREEPASVGRNNEVGEEQDVDEFDEQLGEELKDWDRLTEKEKAEREYYLMEEAHEDFLARTHPLTLQARFSEDRAMISLPNDTLVSPTTEILSSFSNKHLSEAAQKAFGELLQDSVATPSHAAHRHLHQKPPTLTASQSSMSPTEAGVFMACNMPGMYASITTALVETRKRLGSGWIERLLKRQGGPRILDVGSAGVAVQSWREVLHAEWERLNLNARSGAAGPKGKSTVVVGAHELRERISSLSTDTSYLPRLPDFDRARDLPGWERFDPGARKHYDIIVASHTLWPFAEDYQRRDQVQNLWSLLDPNGGVLILIEKGVPRGFEMIGGARDLILKYHIASDVANETISEEITQSRENRHTQREKGMIIAPCTNHGTCPMYPIGGEMRGRKDLCRFAARFVRPPYLKHLIGTRARDQERIRFSFLAVQRGVDLRERDTIVQNETATKRAQAGFEHVQPVNETSSMDPETEEPTTADPEPSMLALPRLILPPLKRHGHVILDVCTPAATLERWVVPRARSRQAYHDARKARWGDLWAMGAKTRTLRVPRTGTPQSASPMRKHKGKGRGPRRRGGAEEVAEVWPEAT